VLRVDALRDKRELFYRLNQEKLENQFQKLERLSWFILVVSDVLIAIPLSYRKISCNEEHLPIFLNI
jgi:hypothetical protein